MVEASIRDLSELDAISGTKHPSWYVLECF